ncbi:MAG: hypothetical protein ACI9SG_000876 [Maribacter sp.]|jgi:hypothetical protein
MKIFYLFITISFLLFSGCSIEDEFTFSERVAGKWVGYNRTVFFKDGSSVDNLSTGICERKTVFILYDNGSLYFEDYKEKEVDTGDVDFCELNLETSDKGDWEVLGNEKLIFNLLNTVDGSEVIIEPFEVRLLNKDNLEIRYKEFKSDNDENIDYLIYKYFRVYGEF